ncbi:MAG: DUF3108 domain-containing protein [Desulforhopalus sp.]
MVNILVILFIIVIHPVLARSEETVPTVKEQSLLPLGIIDSKLLSVGYSGKEKLVYDVSWTGGIKIGELHLEVNALPDVMDGYEIRALVTTENGALNFIYPIEDVHVTKVQGPKRLPYHYEVWQKEGYSYRAHRLIEYNQEIGSIRYMKNDKIEGEYQVEGETNNEFSSFFNSRLMEFVIGRKFVVPTFADKKRSEVIVHAVARKKFAKTLIGPVTTVAIMPIMAFKGLYDKKGDTVIWYTDDECRVPVRINSKILIGSLTAELTGYENSACQRYSGVIK